MKKLVAVEVTSDYIRGAEIEDPFDADPKLRAFGELEIKQGIASDSEVFDIESLSEAFKELWKQEKFSTKQVALGVGGRKILVRNYETPLAEIDKIRARLKFEAANLIPPQMSDAALEFYPARLDPNDGPAVSVHGLLVAAPTEPIDKLITAISSAGLDVQIVDFIPFAIARCARKAFGNTGEYLLVHIRSYSTDIIALKNGIPQMVRVIPNYLIVREGKSGRHRGVADASASFAGDSDASVDPIETIINGIKSTISFYSNKGGNPQALLLAGEGSVSRDIQERLPEALGISAGILELENVIEFPSRGVPTDKITQAATLSTVGIGLRGLKG